MGLSADRARTRTGEQPGKVTRSSTCWRFRNVVSVGSGTSNAIIAPTLPYRAKPRTLPLGRLFTAPDTETFLSRGTMPLGKFASAGVVYLVGAGPGAADLITVRGLRILQSSDVVLHDALISPEVLEDVHPNARIVSVGKRGYCVGSTRQET